MFKYLGVARVSDGREVISIVFPAFSLRVVKDERLDDNR